MLQCSIKPLLKGKYGNKTAGIRGFPVGRIGDVEDNPQAATPVPDLLALRGGFCLFQILQDCPAQSPFIWVLCRVKRFGFKNLGSLTRLNSSHSFASRQKSMINVQPFLLPKCFLLWMIRDLVFTFTKRQNLRCWLLRKTVRSVFSILIWQTTVNSLFMNAREFHVSTVHNKSSYPLASSNCCFW